MPPGVVYVDSSRPELADGFTRKTLTAMVEGVREAAIAAGLIEAALAPLRMLAGLRRAPKTRTAAALQDASGGQFV